MAVRIKQRTFTPAEIFTLNTIPIEILPAPAVGYVNNILTITSRIIFNTVAYTGITSFLARANIVGSSTFMNDSVTPARVASNVQPWLKQVSTWLPPSLIDGLLISGNFAGAAGNSNVIIYVVYETVLIDT